MTLYFEKTNDQQAVSNLNLQFEGIIYYPNKNPLINQNNIEVRIKLCYQDHLLPGTHILLFHWHNTLSYGSLKTGCFFLFFLKVN